MADSSPSVVMNPSEHPPLNAAARDAGLSPRVAALLASACAFTLFMYLYPGLESAVCNYFPDDALFYNLIARNILAGNGSTCDGLGQSNGYHPLWMLALLVLEALPGPGLLYEILLLFLLNVVAVGLLYLWLARLSNPWTAFALCLLTTFEPSVLRVTWSGMETALAWLFLLLTLHLIRAEPPEVWSRRRRWMLRLVLLLLFFSRLDGGLFWVALSLACLFRSPLRPRELAVRAGALMRLFLPLTVPVFAYFAFNQWWFGTAMPISGRIKSIPIGRILTQGENWSDAFLRLRWILSPTPLERIQWFLQQRSADPLGLPPTLLFLTFLLCLVGLTIWMLIRFSDRFALRCLALYVLLHTFYYSVLQADFYSFHWAKGPEVLLFYTVTAVTLGHWFRVGAGGWSGRLASWGFLLLVLVFGALSNLHRAGKANRVNDFSVARRDFFDGLDYLRAHVPAGEPLMTWNIGFLGYFTGRPVVSYDGLLNSRAYYEQYRSKGRVDLYMREHGIRYIANQLPRDGDPATRLSYQFAGLKPDDIEVLAIFEEGADAAKAKNRYVIARCRW